MPQLEISTHTGGWNDLWAMEPSALQRLMGNSVDPRASEAEPVRAAAALAPAAGSAGAVSPYAISGTNALIAVVGPLSKYPNAKDAECGCTFTLQVQSSIAKALADESIEKIVLFIDTPGGTVAGTADLGAYIALAKSIKPIVAYISDHCFSAGYWLASQCGMVYANNSAFIGSIGVYAVLNDFSQASQEAGIKVHLISDGAYKGLETPGLVVDANLLAETQRTVSAAANLFRNAIAAGRSLGIDVVNQLADGRIHVASEALKLGLIDGIGTLDTAMLSIEEKMSTQATPRADAGTPPPADDGTSKQILVLLQAISDKLDKLSPSDAGGDAAAGGADPDMAAKAVAADRDRLKAIYEACPGRAEFAATQFLAGKSATEAKAALADVLSKELVDLKKQNTAAQSGVDPLALAGAGADAGKTLTDPEKIWETDAGGVQAKFSGKKVYFLAAWKLEQSKLNARK